MPAIVHKNAALASKGFALTDQSISTEPTGLVRVALRYTFTIDKQPQLYRLFYPEAPPPEPPPVAIGSLVGKLYMVNYSTQRANGLVTVDAEYVGARPTLDANNLDIYTTTDYESQTVSFDLEIGRRMTNYNAWIQAGGPFSTTVQPIYERVYDRRIVRFTSAIKTEFYTTDYSEAVANSALNSLYLTAGQTTPESLLLGAYWINSGRQTNQDAGTLSPIVTNAFDPLLNEINNAPITLIEIPSQNLGVYQESNALEFLRKMCRLNNNYVSARVTTNLTVENASQKVRVIGRQLSLRFIGKLFRGDSIIIGT
jgi:hypothetical protein